MPLRNTIARGRILCLGLPRGRGGKGDNQSDSASTYIAARKRKRNPHLDFQRVAFTPRIKGECFCLNLKRRLRVPGEKRGGEKGLLDRNLSPFAKKKKKRGGGRRKGVRSPAPSPRSALTKERRASMSSLQCRPWSGTQRREGKTRLPRSGPVRFVVTGRGGKGKKKKRTDWSIERVTAA